MCSELEYTYNLKVYAGRVNNQKLNLEHIVLTFYYLLDHIKHQERTLITLTCLSLSEKCEMPITM